MELAKTPQFQSGSRALYALVEILNNWGQTYCILTFPSQAEGGFAVQSSWGQLLDNVEQLSSTVHEACKKNHPNSRQRALYASVEIESTGIS